MHASKSKGLFFAGKDGLEQPVSPEKLREYFETISHEFRPHICLLSACNTIEHAEAISPFVDFVVGTRDFFPDSAAMIYAEKFYEVLFEGTQVKTAHRTAIQALKDANERNQNDFAFQGQEFPVYEIPVLFPEY